MSAGGGMVIVQSGGSCNSAAPLSSRHDTDSGPLASDPPGLSLNVVDREGEPWFVARDVCDVLGIRDTGQALDSIHPTGKAVQTMGLRGSAPWTVNESGCSADHHHETLGARPDGVASLV